DLSAAEHARERYREIMRGLRTCRLPLRGLESRYMRNGRDEPITPAGYRHDIAIARLAVAECPAQRGHMDAKIALLDEGVRPDAGDKVVLADHAARTLDQNLQEFERSATQSEGLSAFKQEVPRRKQAERAKRDDTIGRRPQRVRHFNPA